MNNAVDNYKQTVLDFHAGTATQNDVDVAKTAAVIKGDEYATLTAQVKQDDPNVSNDDQLFSNPGRMNALVRDDIATILSTGSFFGSGLKLLVDTEGNASGVTNVILSFAEGSDVTIDWGDASARQTYTGAASHTYVDPGQYEVQIIGTVNGFTRPLSESRQQLKDVMQWGVVEFANIEKMFQQRTGFVISASDGPILLPGASCYQMFNNASDFNSNINHWDMSNVVNMDAMFLGAKAFNQPLNDWDVSNVVDMASMFNTASAFNQSLNNWDVSNVVDMSRMFYYTSLFNQPLNSWNVSSVTTMSFMFRVAAAFNQPLNAWNVSSVTSMNDMFNQADAFNRPLNSWNVSSVTSMAYMFANADSFNQNLNAWDVSQVTSFPGFNADSALSGSNLPNF